MRFKLLLFSVCCCFTMSVLGQSRKEFIDREVESEKISRQALKLWKDEAYGEAEKLYAKALNLFPHYNVFIELAERKLKLGDIKGANKVWDDLSQQILSIIPQYYKPAELVEHLELVYANKGEKNFKEGDAKAGVAATLKYLELFKEKKPGASAHSLMESACNVAFFLDDKKSLQEISSLCRTFDKDPTGDAKFGLFISEVFFMILDRQFEAAEEKLVDVIQNKGGFAGSKAWAKSIAPYLYIAKKDYKKMEESVAVYRESAPGIFGAKYIDKLMSNFYGYVAMYKGNHKEAIAQFTQFINRKILFGFILPLPEKFKYYTLRAECYEKTNEFDKARKDYEAALVYNPDFEPALTGIARLESRIIAGRKSDKTAPLIVITEPVIEQVVTETERSEILIKGLAEDPGGLKSVTINGEKGYSQEGGVFWGNVVLKDGVNKILITATDFSGNTAEKVIEFKRTAGSSTAATVAKKEGKNYALLIGCQNYDDNSIQSLEDPIPDAIKLKLILKNNYNFNEENLFTLFNPEQSDLKKQFLEIYEVIQPEDNLVIFYAGHGIWVEKEKKGYWLLTDAKLNDPNTWVSNKIVLEMIARISAHHTLMITDACFSGSVFRTRGVDIKNKESGEAAAMQQLNQKISRVAITSGNDTEVPDKSVFMKYLVKALGENKDKYLTAQKMFVNHIIEAVMSETRTEPRYGTLELAGHVGGDFIFMKK